MKTLHTTYRVSDLAGSLAFYEALGYEEVGRREVGEDGASLTCLKLPGEGVVTLQLGHHPGDAQIEFGGFRLPGGPVEIGTGLSHIVVQVEDLEATLAQLSDDGLSPEPLLQPAGPAGPSTAWISDPDGYRIELVEWPAGHADGMTAADFA
jgi:lactoylglutathione lyase